MVMTNEEFIGKTPTPEALIRLSIKHLEEAEKRPNYGIYMPSWFSRLPGNKCGVCLGAATLVFGLGKFRRMWADAHLYNNEWEQMVPRRVYNRIMAINYFRIGKLKTALEGLGCWDEKKLKNHSCYYMPEYKDHPRNFKDKLFNLAIILERHKLLINTRRKST